MKYLVTFISIVGLTACTSPTEKEIIIRDQIDCHEADSNGRFVDDSVFIANQTYIDSLKNVEELLDYLETIPATHR